MLEHAWSHSKSENQIEHLSRGHPLEAAGVWFCAQPYNGGRSWSEPNITDWRFIVVESDEAPESDWLQMLAQLRLPIVAIYTSGGRSIHALIRCDAFCKSDWDHVVWHQRVDSSEDTIGSRMLRLGACQACLSAVRLTRLPGCYRGEKGKWQELLWLNPGADGKPIHQKEEKPAGNQPTGLNT
jgi:hypothetical protein